MMSETDCKAIDEYMGLQDFIYCKFRNLRMALNKTRKIYMQIKNMKKGCADKNSRAGYYMIDELNDSDAAAIYFRFLNFKALQNLDAKNLNSNSRKI